MNTFDNNDFPREAEMEQHQSGQTPEGWTDAPTEQLQPQSAPEVIPSEPQRVAEQSYPTQQQSTYRNAGVGRRESPFANGPYVTYDQLHRAEQPFVQPQPQPVQPVHEPVRAEAPVRNAAPKKKKTFWKTAIAAVLVLALVAGSCFATAAIVNSSWEKKAQQMSDEYDRQFQNLNQQLQDLQQQITSGGNSVPGSPVASAGGMTPSQVYAKNVDAVVMVHCEIVYSNYGQTGTSTGSGFIISENGYVMTNYHVVEGATSVSVSTHDGVSYTATVIGYDDTNDVALLKADATGLPCVSIGSSDDLIVGDQVVAIGNPLGELTSTMTVGYISGKERAVNTDGTVINMIQTDAAINSGNSGGPLFNMNGEVIGITTAKYSGSSSSGASIEGIGFAIPIDDVMGVIDELMEFGYIKTAYMGVTVQEMTTDMKMMAEVYNLPVGLFVASVEADGPSYAAGIQPEDIIIKLADIRITSISDLTRALREYEPGDTTTVTVFRAGAEIQLDITLEEKPQELPNIQEQQTEPDSKLPEEGDYDEWFDYFFPNG